MLKRGSESTTCDVGLIGLGVMGRNLVLNLADHGYRAAVYNRTTSATQKFLAEHGDDPFPDG
ncbi:MAG: NAD(P)-binding domain-containing protein, partial [Planctomycetota bacterium]|nr:NAD(P)-binding domain-containing protein [Planctomycetota bacterium]